MIHPVELSAEQNIYLFLQVGQFASAENYANHVLLKVCVRRYLCINVKNTLG